MPEEVVGELAQTIALNRGVERGGEGLDDHVEVEVCVYDAFGDADSMPFINIPEYKYRNQELCLRCYVALAASSCRSQRQSGGPEQLAG